MTAVITDYATYVPAYRLGPDSGVQGRRIVASFDETSTTMAVAALRSLRRAPTELPSTALNGGLWFATTSPDYLDKTNASAIHAALGLDASMFAADLIGSGRSTLAGMRAAAANGGVVVAADVRVGRPGSADERSGGDGAAAVVFGEGDGIAEVLSTASVTDELLDRWRRPTSRTAEAWEERFGFERHVELVRETSGRALADAGITEVDHVVLASSNAAVTKRAGTVMVGGRTTVASPVGFSGAPDLLLGLAEVLDTAEADQTILLVSAVDGCDAWVLRTTTELPNHRQARPLAAQLDGGIEVPYPTYLAWRGLLEPEPPRRPEPDRPSGPSSLRGADWKFRLSGGRCGRCGFVHLPPLRVCRECGATDEMEPVPIAGRRGRVATHTVDHLAYSPSPPIVDVVVDLDGGGRCALEVADAVPGSITVGTEVDLTFRSLFVADGIHNYFWKARVADGEQPSREVSR